MTQQENDFGEINHEEPLSSYTGYAPQSLEEQFAKNTTSKSLSTNQRLVLAIVSLVLLLLLFLAITISIAITSPGLLLPIAVINLVFFFTALRKVFTLCCASVYHVWLNNSQTRPMCALHALIRHHRYPHLTLLADK